MRITHSTLILAPAILSAITFAQTTPWTSDDILLQESVQQVRLSPDGKMAVYIKSQMDKEKGTAVSNLFLRYLDDMTEVQLTRGKDTHLVPRFSPDGKRLAWMSSRKPEDGAGTAGPAGEDAYGQPPGAGSQIWMINLRGGEPWSVTKFEKGVRAFEFLDNDTMLIAAPEDSNLHDQKTKEKKDTSNVVDDEKHATPVRLFRFNLKSRAAERLSSNSDRIQRMFVSPDSQWAVTTHERSLHYIYDQKIKPATFLYNLKTGAAAELFPDGKLRPAQVEWQPDSKGFDFIAPFTNHPKYENATINRLHHFDLDSRQAALFPLDWANGVSSGFQITKDGMLVSLANGARNKTAVYRKNGATWTRAMLEGDHAAGIFGLEANTDTNTVLYNFTNASTPRQWYVAQLNGAKLESPKAVTEGSFKKKPISKTEVVTWKGAKDEQVEGILYYPHNYTPGKKHPLVVMIHGGPHGADFDGFNESWGYPHQMMAQRGAFVLKPNYHGSSNYGLEWGESISGGNYNELEWIDVEKGVDSLIAKGLVDADKLGVMGWSNGSIISIELTTRTTRYKVASAGAGDVNWTSDWGNAVFGHAFDDYYMGKTPLEDPMLYVKKSPLFRMDKVRTPTIIFFGTEDKQVPTEQGWQHSRALQHLGKTDARFILFPGEAHGPRRYVHQKRKLDEELAWFDRYLFGTFKEENESFKPDSPLAAMLKRKAIGEKPELVTRGEIQIARFEVTRAQYAAFDPAYKVAAGTEHYPATGVTFDKAKAYAEWLAKKTGQKFRLGTEEELGAMLKASKSENTLDAWAGYNVSVDDAKRLASLVDGLGDGALLKPVGSFAGSGDDPIFDLNGNASEWVVKKDGSGKAMGGSADWPVDPKSVGEPRVSYIGFRVVADLK